MRPGRRVAVLAAALTLAAACRRPAAPSSLRIGHEADVLGLDPVLENDDPTLSVLSNVYEPLVTFDRDMTLVPALAASWRSPDDATWVFELRPGVRFHDGQPLTAAAAKQALDRARSDPASKLRGYFAAVAAVEAKGERTLELKTRERDPLLLNRLATVLIVRANGAALAGTGPYRIVRWDRGHGLTVEAFADYWGGRPAIQRVEFVPVPEGERSVEALRKREADVVRAVPDALVERVAALPGVRVVSRPSLWNRYLFMDTTERPGGPRNPFADRRVRRAVSLAIDRKELVRRLGGRGLPSNQIAPQGVFGYQPGFPELAFDPAAARGLLREAGFPSGFPVTLTFDESAPSVTVAELVKRTLGECGIDVRLERVSRAERFRRWHEGRLPFFIGGWLFDSVDATSFLRDCVYTRDRSKGIGTYNAGFSSPAVDRLIDENTQIAGQSSRSAHYERLMRAVMDEMPLVPLDTGANVYGVAQGVVFHPRLDGRLLAFEMALRP